MVDVLVVGSKVGRVGWGRIVKDFECFGKVLDFIL